jgi:hypothetical protein
MSQTHPTRQTVRPGAERRHDDHRKEGPDSRHFTPANHTRTPGLRWRVVAAPGGVAFVEENPVG